MVIANLMNSYKISKCRLIKGITINILLRISNHIKIEDIRAMVYFLNNIGNFIFLVYFSYLTKVFLKLPVIKL